MKKVTRLIVRIGAFTCIHAAGANETVMYTYDALGRVTNMSTSGGVSSGVQQSFSYDAGGNVKGQQTYGPLTPRTVVVSPASTTVGEMGANALIAVTLSGASPGGSVSFIVDDRYLGTAVINNGRASIRVTGLPPGTYTVTATYAGDTSNDPAKLTFTVRVRDISWLPSVLQLLLSP